MTQTRNLAPLVMWFCGQMMKTFAEGKNVQKPDWRGVSVADYMVLIEKQILQLQRIHTTEGNDYPSTIKRMTDIANLACLAAGVAMIELKEAEF